MVGAAEQKAVLPPINLMKPTHQFPILTFFPNYARLIRCGVKPQEPNVKNSMLSACHGGKLPCADRSAGTPHIQTKILLSLMSPLSPTDDPTAACACMVTSSSIPRSLCTSWKSPLMTKGAAQYRGTGTALLAEGSIQGEALMGMLGGSSCITSFSGARPCQLTWHTMAWLVQPSAWAEAPLGCRGLMPP